MSLFHLPDVEQTFSVDLAYHMYGYINCLLNVHCICVQHALCDGFLFVVCLVIGCVEERREGGGIAEPSGMRTKSFA